MIYAGVTFVLRRFPYTRPWGESMREFLLTTVGSLGLRRGSARFPGCSRSLLIALIARFLARLIRLWFDAVERGRITGAMDLSRNRAADAPVVDRAAVAVCDRRGLSRTCQAARPTRSKASASFSA